jgi:hypothetical protein
MAVFGGTEYGLSPMLKAKVVKTSFSIDPELLEDAQFLARRSGYRYSFSAWVSDIIKEKIDQCQGSRNRLTQTSLDSGRNQ